MSYALTSKSQVTVPKAMRLHMHLHPLQEVDYEPLADGSVRMFPVKSKATENPFLKFIGIGVSGMTTEEILNETRGEGWNK